MLHFAPIFLAVFVAELGDKTQLATVLFAADGDRSPLGVFAAAAAALVLSTAVAVALGSLGAKHLQSLPLKAIAGTGFIVIGAWTLADHFRGG